MRKLPLLLAAMLVIGAPAVWGQLSDGVLDRCLTLARISSEGKLDQIRNPVFTDREAARRFSLDCRKVADELGHFATLPPEYAELREQAALAAEFLTGETYVLSTCQVASVIKLREGVKIPPPSGFVYVKKYASESVMPPVVQAVFGSLKRSDEARAEGVTVRGRYIALLQTEYHAEVEDNLAHELVHAYLTLACKSELPRWFQEAAAVYFSTGEDTKLYNKTNDPRIIKGVTLPEDYRSDLYSFQYLEDKIGRDKLYKFIRLAVETGNPNARTALGMRSPVPQDAPIESPRSPWLIPIVLIAAGILVASVYAWVVSRREESTW